MIVVEGPDGAGKTTLAKRLAEQFSLEYSKPPSGVLSSREGPVGPPKGLIEWWDDQINLPAAVQRKLIYDRVTYISDPIYRLAQGTLPQGTGMEMSKGIIALASYALIIFCLPTWEQAKANIYSDLEARPVLEGVDEERHQIIHWAYECQYHLWKETAFDRVLAYDWTNYDRIAEEVEEYLA